MIGSLLIAKAADPSSFERFCFYCQLFMYNWGNIRSVEPIQIASLRVTEQVFTSGVSAKTLPHSIFPLSLP